MTAPTSPEGILVLGLPRSGTTLIRRLLNAHSHLACPGETNLFGSCARFLRSESFSDGIPVGVLTGLRFMGFEEQEILERLREFAFQFHREYLRKQGKRIWADKSPLDVFYLDTIERLVGDRVHYICLHRHALDVACSLVEFCDKSGGYLNEIHRYVVQFPQPLVAFAHMWVDVTQALLRLAERHPANAISIKYEDVIADPDRQMKRIMEFAGVEWEPDLVSRAMHETGSLGMGDWKTYAKTTIDNKSIGRWTSLPRAAIESIAKIVNPTLVSCGYDSVATEDKSAEVDVHRKYLLGLMVQKMRNETGSK